jgi:hypothetical protein
MTTAAVDLFGNPVMPPLRVRLDRQIDRDKPCCNNVAIVGPGKAQHAAELRCETCDAHRGWLRREALNFLTDLSQRFGAPAEPIILRDQQIGDHIMADKQYDNSGILYRNRNKSGERDRDYKGEATVAGVKYWVSGWIKQAKNGSKFVTFSFKAKDAPATKPKSSLTDELDDAIGF